MAKLGYKNVAEAEKARISNLVVVDAGEGVVNTEVIITPAFGSITRYFIFRQDGQEIEVNIKDGIIKSSKRLFPCERDYLNKYYL